MFVTFKEAASRILTPHASAILLDPEYGLAAAKQRAKSAGLLLAYEQTGYDKQVRGRMPRLLAGWKAQRLVEAGADSVKLLLYYSTPSSAGVNNARHEFVKRMGAECAAADVPFFLEWSAAERAATTPARSWLRRNPKSWHGVWRNFLSQNTA